MHVEYPVGKGTADGYLATPASGGGPGVLVLHAWWGLNAFVERLCDRLAAEGFVAFAPDLYHGAVAATIDDAKKLRSGLDSTLAGKELKAAAAHLRTLPGAASRIGVLGLSLGGYWALWLAEQRPTDVAAVVTFYGARSGRSGRSRAACQGHFAESDPYAPAAYVAGLEGQLRSAGQPVEFYFYPGVGHWFFEDDRPDAYAPEAAALAWERTLAFLRKTLAAEEGDVAPSGEVPA